MLSFSGVLVFIVDNEMLVNLKILRRVTSNSRNYASQSCPGTLTLCWCYSAHRLHKFMLCDKRPSELKFGLKALTPSLTLSPL